MVGPRKQHDDQLPVCMYCILGLQGPQVEGLYKCLGTVEVGDCVFLLQPGLNPSQTPRLSIY